MQANRIGDRLLALRKKLNLTQNYLAEITEVSQSNYSKYEKNIIEPNYSFLTKIIDKLDVDSEWLLFGKGTINKSKSINNTDFYEDYQKLKDKVQSMEMEIADLRYDNSKLQSKIIQLSEELLDNYKELLEFKINQK